MRSPLAMVIVALTLVAPGKANNMVTLREVTEDAYPFIARIVAPGAAAMAMSEAAGLVAVTHEGPLADQVKLFSLDPTGALTDAPPISIVLPKRGALAGHANYALGLTFHPTLPLLYVWQDVKAPQNADADTFEHLLIFRIVEGKAELVQACGKGHDYAVGREVGYIAVDQKATRLYFPNLAEMRKGASINGVGYFALGEDGLVVAAAGTAGGDFVGQRETVFSEVIPTNDAGGFVPVSDAVAIFAGGSGAISWDMVEARQELTLFNMWPPARPNRRLCAHPTLPVLYMSLLRTSFVHRVKHAEGYFTSNFQMTTLWVTCSPPVVLGRRQAVAVGGTGEVLFISIDEQGDFLPEVRRARVTKEKVSALSYSETFDKLYVAVDPD